MLGQPQVVVGESDNLPPVSNDTCCSPLSTRGCGTGLSDFDLIQEAEGIHYLSLLSDITIYAFACSMSPWLDPFKSRNHSN